jgi:hypothetical protein
MRAQFFEAGGPRHRRVLRDAPHSGRRPPRTKVRRRCHTAETTGAILRTRRRRSPESWPIFGCRIMVSFKSRRHRTTETVGCSATRTCCPLCPYPTGLLSTMGTGRLISSGSSSERIGTAADVPANSATDAGPTSLGIFFARSRASFSLPHAKPRTNGPFLRDSRGGHFVIRVIGKGMSTCVKAWHVRSPGYTSAQGDSTHSLRAHNVTSLNGRHPIPQP